VGGGRGRRGQSPRRKTKGPESTESTESTAVGGGRLSGRSRVEEDDGRMLPVCAIGGPINILPQQWPPLL
jgi:hypothetical protein